MTTPSGFPTPGGGTGPGSFIALLITLANQVNKLGLAVNPTGVADSSTILAAMNRAGDGGVVILGPGLWKWELTTGIVNPYINQTWYSNGTEFGSGGSAISELSFPNVISGRTCLSVAASFMGINLSLFGPSIAGVTVFDNAQTANGVVTMIGCHFYNGDIGVSLNASFYSTFIRCEWRHNNICLDLTNTCYNVTLHDPTFTAVTYALGNGICIRADAVESLNVQGGSFENYGILATPGIQITNKTTRSNINLVGTYWESTCTNAIGIDINNCQKVNLKIIGAEVIISNHSGWIYTHQTKSTSSLYSIGVTWSGTTSTTTPICYFTDDAATVMSMEYGAGDVWDVGAIGANYDDGTGGLRLANVNMQYPSAYTGTGSSSKNQRFFGRAITVPLLSWLKTGSGVTGSRPAAATSGAGATWYDTTLKKPTWSDGTAVRVTYDSIAAGNAVLVAGTVTIADVNITANSVIRLSSKTLGGTPGSVFVSAKVAATSFSITSTNALDTSTIFYEIIDY